MQEVLDLTNFLGTPNAILHSFGMQVYHEASSLLQSHHSIVLNFSGLHSLTSAFAHASVGNLCRDLGADFEVRVVLQGLEMHPDWQEKITDALELVRHPEQARAAQEALAELFED